MEPSLMDKGLVALGVWPFGDVKAHVRLLSAPSLHESHIPLLAGCFLCSR